ncbi:hypothetical protein [Paracoccus sp. (in: a-proteobacteria)]|uniref:hypothetical protein n=1 Tax=Paracoccus sp. TaxID=267 RepID=UPI00321F7AE5
MTIIRFIRSFFGTLGAAAEISAAARAHRKPRPAALARLGIDRQAFNAIHL